jgi:membrane fusion protein, heavy metal efflux system
MNNKIKIGSFVGGGVILGIVIGFCFRADGVFAILKQAVGVSEADAETDENKAESHTNLELAEETQKSMGLKLKRLKTSSYTQAIAVPAMIVEKPGHSGRTIPSRVHGVVTTVHCVTGQLVKAGDRLFDVKLTGDALVAAQTNLLNTIQELANEQQELERVTKLVEAGTVIGQMKVPLQYEVRRLTSLLDVRRQELLVRGLTNEQAELVTKDKKLISEFTIRVPNVENPNELMATNAADDTSKDSDDPPEITDSELQAFTVESIDVHPGQSISPGDRLAHLARHDALYIKGFAFERDLSHVTSLREKNWQASLEIGETGHQKVVEGFDVHFIDNHVDPSTGAFHFYLELKNSILSESKDSSNRVFRSWTYRPGQRLHIRLPIQEFTDQLVLPISAIARDGAESYVFRRLKRHHLHAAGENEDEGSHAHLDEYQRVSVAVLYRDSQNVVVSKTGDLKVGDLVAMNLAHQLYAAQQSQTGQGHAGHDHGPGGHSH